MKLTVPLYTEKFAAPDGSGTVFHVRPLFSFEPDATRRELQRATNSVRSKLRRELESLGRRARHEDLSVWAFSPEMQEQRLDLELHLRRRSFRGRYLFVTFEAMGRRVALTPGLPMLAFALERGEDLKERATDVLTRYYRKLEREEGAEAVKPEAEAMRGSAWITLVDVNVSIDRVYSRPSPSRRAEIGGFLLGSGREELERVGRNQNALYPDDLQRAVLREEEVEELDRLLSEREQRPILLLGRRGVGKTAVIHEQIRRAMSQGKLRHGDRGQTWLISPQRLISGMSYAGQWESRLHLILAETRKRRHLLLFDDLVGLFRAGQTSGSDLSLAQVIKPAIERREVRVLAEMTPEALRVFRELDRGFADLFHILRIEEPAEDRNLEILIHVTRQLEPRAECSFELEVLPTVLALQRRYAREEAFPGKAADFLQQLALKNRDCTLTRADVLEEFHARSGLSVSFLDERVRLEREDIVAGLKEMVIGQDAAIEALADTVSVAKGLLNDPERPLGTFLFLGPTGVGKTQCAKALASYLYGSEDKLLRFDMNEFGDAAAVARLAGTLRDPEGLLTGAVRRQPFAVLLLDEIEKAHPEAFDLLLQLLGEGRLTDALGRTADFTNCIVIMTSNLGVREAEAGMGFGDHTDHGDEAYLQAARRFFRPEFFNRLDRVIPFNRLPREQIEQISQIMIRDVLARDGLSRRRCVLQVDPLAMERVVDQGYHPQLGARAIRRAIENQLTRPLAAKLASLSPDTPTVIKLMAQGDGIAVQMQALEPAVRLADSGSAVDLADTDAVLARMDTVLNRAEEILDELRPHGAVSATEVTPEQRRYYALREQFEWLDAAVQRFVDRIDALAAARKRRPESAARHAPRAPRREELAPVGADAWTRFCQAADAREWIGELDSETPGDRGEIESRLRRLLASTAYLQLMLETAAHDERVLVLIDSAAGRPGLGIDQLTHNCVRLFRHRMDLGVERLESTGPGCTALVVSGYLASALARAERGTHLFEEPAGLMPVKMNVILVGDRDPTEVAAQYLSAGRAWAEAVARAEQDPSNDPDPIRPVLRVYFADGAVLDLRTRLISMAQPAASTLRLFTLLSMPVGGKGGGTG